MRTYAQKPKTSPPTTSKNSTIPSRIHLGQGRVLNSVLNPQRTIGNQADQRLLHEYVEDSKADSGGVSSPRFAHDFSRVPVLSGRTTLEEEVEEVPGPVSQSLDAGTPRDAGVSLPGGVPTPAPATPVTPPSPPPPRCTITTRTLASAPDGTADTRRTVGVNEQVEMTSSASAAWTASSGTVAPVSGTTVVWTSPGAGATCTVTAAPAAGSPCSVLMSVIPPSSRSLVKQTDRAYTVGKAGSGFTANVTIMPLGVSFTRTELREDTVNSVATGYYDTVLGWNGLAHPPTAWLRPNASNSGLVDNIGTSLPGSPGPFSSGTFLWAIPQCHRTPGTSGSGAIYSTANHTQVMGGASGAETTSKEGASRSRTP